MSTFRQHYYFQPPEGLSHTPLSQLCYQWVDYVARTPASTLDRWRRTEPTLAGQDLGQLVDAADAAPPQVANEMFRGLVTLAQAGDSLAAVTIQQCLMPRLSTSMPLGVDHASFQTERLGSLWVVIGRLPLATTNKVYGRLIQDTLHKFPSEARPKREVLVDPHHQEGVREDVEIRNVDLLDLLFWARETNAITLSEVNFLMDVYLPSVSENPTSADLAALMGIEAGTLRVRCHRLAKRLQTAVVAARHRGDALVPSTGHAAMMSV